MIPQGDLRVIDPVWTTAYLTRNHGYMVYDTLFGTDSKFEPQPQMVESWRVSEDRLTYAFTLREGLAFHDGQKVEPADCIASLARWMKRDVLGQKLGEAVAEMKEDGERGFAIVLKRPFPLTIAALAKISGNPFIMPARVAATDPMKQITDATGSGPFKFAKDEFQPGHLAVYLRNEAYRPRSEKPDWSAGGKTVKVDRVEWIYIPDGATAANALQAGEVDWWERTPTDFAAMLEKRGGISMLPTDPIGFFGVLGLNHLQPPFNNEKIRQALLAAVDQGEYMGAVAGEPKYWVTCHSVYACGTPMASEAGAERVAGKRDLEAAKRMLKEAGYKGERVVLLDATDYPQLHAEALVTAELLKKLGMNVDMQSSDWGTVVTRRAKMGPVEEGGWSIFHTSFQGPDILDPSVHSGLRADGIKAWFGWATDPKLEALKGAWLESEDEIARKRIAAAIQEQAFASVPYIPLGRFLMLTAFRNTVTGIMNAPMLAMWGVEKQ